MAIDYNSTKPVDLQAAVRDLNARLSALNTKVNPPAPPVAPPAPPAPPKP